MEKGLEKLAEMEYPGRFIIIGKDTNATKNNIVIYGITGRSESSQARTLEFDEKNNLIFTKPSDEKKISEGIQSLLIYPAIIFLPEERGIAVSNGYQTNLINTLMKNYPNRNAGIAILEDALTKSHLIYDLKQGMIDVTCYEPDSPNFTPRISGCLKGRSAGLHLVVKEDGCFNKKCWPVELEPGKGKLISTYTGENKNPLPSFQEKNPLDVEIFGKTPTEIAEIVYESIAPQNGADFRVSVAVAMQSSSTGKVIHHIINRYNDVKE